MVIFVDTGIPVEFERYVFVSLADNLDVGNYTFEWKLVGYCFAGSKKRGVSHGFAGGGIPYCSTGKRSVRTVAIGDDQIEFLLLDADEVVDVGVPYVDLEEALVLKEKFEVVTGTVFSQFDENPSVRGGMRMAFGAGGVFVPVMVETA